MRVKRVACGVLAGAGVLVLAAASAWACVSGPSVTLSPTSAKPGQEVTATVRDIRKADPVQVRWNALDGPVLATFTQAGDGAPFQGKFTVPETAKAGSYVVVFGQSSADGKVTQAPVRALLNVTSADGASPVLGASVAPVDAGRPAGLVTTDSSVSAGTFLLVALGVAGVGLFVVGAAALFAGRSTKAPEAAPARK